MIMSTIELKKDDIYISVKSTNEFICGLLLKPNLRVFTNGKYVTHIYIVYRSRNDRVSDSINLTFRFTNASVQLMIEVSNFLLIQPQSELDIGSWYVTYLPTPPYPPTQNSPCCCCSSWIIKAISLVICILLMRK